MEVVTVRGLLLTIKENQRFSVRSVNDGIAKNERHPMDSSQSARCHHIAKKHRTISCAFLLVTRTGLEPMLPP